MNKAKACIRLFTAILGTALIAGCGSVGSGDATTIPYKPKPGKGLVIVYREHTSLFREGWVGRIVNFRHVYDNGHDLGKLSGGTLFIDDASPGKHAFHAKDEDTKLNLDVAAGKTYFIKAELNMGMWSPDERLEVVEFSEGAEALRELEKGDPPDPD